MKTAAKLFFNQYKLQLVGMFENTKRTGRQKIE
jgi:hypothetical protein